MKAFGYILIYLAGTWGCVCALMKCVSVCFDLDFDLTAATAVWILLGLMKFLLDEKKG